MGLFLVGKIKRDAKTQGPPSYVGNIEWSCYIRKAVAVAVSSIRYISKLFFVLYFQDILNRSNMEPLPVPLPLQAFVTVNSEFKILVCLVDSCRCAVQPAILSSHLLRKHRVGKAIRKRAEEYIKQWQ
jgi:hypothetical protein